MQGVKKSYTVTIFRDKSSFSIMEKRGLLGDRELSQLSPYPQMMRKYKKPRGA